jgi:hypothetical protein
VRTVLPHSYVDAPAFEPRGNVVSAATPPRLRCVMPAFVPAGTLSCRCHHRLSTRTNVLVLFLVSLGHLAVRLRSGPLP